MNSAIAILKALLHLDTSEYKAGIRGAETETNRFGSMLAGIGQTLGAAFSVGSVIAFAKQVLDMGAKLTQSAENAGVLTSEMIALHDIFRRHGVEEEVVVKVLSRVRSTLYEAAMGSEEAKKKFAALGLTWKDLSLSSPVEALQQIVIAAEQTGMPVSVLTNLFGEKLGPRAMGALQEIAKNGLGPLDKGLAQSAERAKGWSVEMKEAGHAVETSFLRWMPAVSKGLGELLGNASALLGLGTVPAIMGTIQKLTGGGAAPKENIPTAEGPSIIKEASAAAMAKFDENIKKEIGAEIEKGISSAVESDRKQAKSDNAASIRAQREFERSSQISRPFFQRMRAEEDASAERIAGIAGQGHAVSSLAAVGGFTGRERGGLGIADRALKVAQEHKASSERIERILGELRDATKRSADSQSGGAPS